jgi:hypothetical protein
LQEQALPLRGGGGTAPRLVLVAAADTFAAARMVRRDCEQKKWPMMSRAERCSETKPPTQPVLRRVADQPTRC